MSEETDKQTTPERPVAAAAPGSANAVDAEYLAEHGHIKVIAAQNLHAYLMRSRGITEPDEIVADWNRRDPEAPWGSGNVGKYVRELSQLCCDFMADQIREAGGPDVQCDLGQNDQTESPKQ